MIRANDQALIVFIKWPEPGKVKTRLQPELSQQESLELYKAMTEDIVMRFNKQSELDLILFCDSPAASDDMESWLGKKISMVPQSGINLGERMNNAFKNVLEKGYEKVLLTGSDIPALDQKILFNAFAGLEYNDVVLGPSYDGGYYLIGMNQMHPCLFQDMRWSSDSVFNETIKRIHHNKLRYKILSILNDIDTFDDLRDLWNYYQQAMLKNNTVKQSKTFQVLSEIMRII